MTDLVAALNLNWFLKLDKLMVLHARPGKVRLALIRFLGPEKFISIIIGHLQSTKLFFYIATSKANFLTFYNFLRQTHLIDLK